MAADRVAQAAPPIGGHNETSENFTSAAGGWLILNMTPGWLPGSLTGSHLLITEVAPRGAGTGASSDSSEYLEIANPTSSAVMLDDYYISDNLAYYGIVAGPYAISPVVDYNLRFPPGNVLNPGEVLLVVKSELGFLTTFGGLAGWNSFCAANSPSGSCTNKVFAMDNKVHPPSVFMPMIDAAGSSLGTSGVGGGDIAGPTGAFTNPGATTGEWVVLFRWDGLSDLVCDVDYASWGANNSNNPKMNKSGVSFDGPDADLLVSSYNSDTPAGSQSNLGESTALTKPNTYQRVDGEVGEITGSGNGCIGITAPPVLTCPGPVTVQCGAQVPAPDPSVVGATDNCGGGVTVVFVSDVVSDQTCASRYHVTRTYQGTDACGNMATCTQIITVDDDTPPVVTITGPSSGAVYSVGTAVGFTGGFTDNCASTHTATWTFDAISQPGTVNEGAGTASTTYTFTAAGVYMVTLTVTDACGNAGMATTVGGVDAMVVIYDPNAGFVTGGGWIDSPPGAYPDSPSLTGKANFGFVSKYRKGATTPTGETEFQFKVADLDFHSTSYQWLVVSGSRAQYKGSGTLNGDSGYGFLLTAVDGQITGGGGTDKFRMKITNSLGVVYDNQIADPDDATPNTELGGGSIVIHSTSSGTQTMPASDPGTVEPVVPVDYALSQNLPNPFGAGTEIQFSLPERSSLRIAVYDLLGREVKTLADGEWGPGRHLASWLGEGGGGSIARAGIYFVRMTARSMSSDRHFSSIRKVVLAR